MTYHLLQSILGATFIAVWAFIAVTMLRDKLIEARAKRVKASPPAPKFSKRQRKKRDRDRVVAGA